MITGPYHRPRFNVAEAKAQRLIPQINKFLWLVEASDWQVIFRGPQVLADGKNIDPARPEIVKHFDQLFA